MHFFLLFDCKLWLRIANKKFYLFQGVANIASLSLAIGYPTLVSVPHSIVNGFKNLLAVAASTEISFKQAETVSSVPFCCAFICV